MKRVDVAYGILERLNDIMGTTGITSGNDLNDWSIQECQMENLRRVIASLTNNSDGRIGYGLEVNPTSKIVGAGVAFTQEGEIIYWPGTPTYRAPGAGKLYMKYLSVRTNQHESTMTNSNLSKVNIVIDNDTDPSNIFVISSSKPENSVLIATINTDGTIDRPVNAGFFNTTVGASTPGTTGVSISTIDKITVVNGLITNITYK